MKDIAFRDSKVREIIEQALVSYFELSQGYKVEKKSLEDLLKLYEQESVLYVSEWLIETGLDTLKHLEEFKYRDNEEYQAYIEMRSLILEMDREFNDVDALFISLTELINSALEFAKYNGCKVSKLMNTTLESFEDIGYKVSKLMDAPLTVFMDNDWSYAENWEVALKETHSTIKGPTGEATNLANYTSQLIENYEKKGTSKEPLFFVNKGRRAA